MRAVGVYIFAGGFTVGVKEAGFQVVAHLEDGPFGVATTKLNHPELAGHVHTDPARWPLDEFRGVDFVYANPPCAPFSLAARTPKDRPSVNEGWYERDPRVSCIYQTFDVLERVLPTVWAFETVAQAWRVAQPMLDALAARAAALGYAASYLLLDVADCGLPQRRRRLFTVFHRVAIDWKAPDAPRRTVRDAIGALVEERPEAGHMSPSTKQYIDRCPPGGSLRDAWEDDHGKVRGGGVVVKGRPRFIERRLEWDTQSFTFTGSAHLMHPDENRTVTVREAALLCGYPAGYQFAGPTNNKYAQIAKAVTPPAGAWLARNVAAGIEAGVAPTPERIAAPEVYDYMGFIRAAPGGAAPREPREKREPVVRAARPSAAPARPAQESGLPDWETFSGPTSIAKVLIAEGHGDAEIIATTSAAIRGAKEAGAKWPHLFTGTDLVRLRARIVKNAQKEEVVA